MERSSPTRLNDMTTLIEKLEKEMEALNPERLNFFICWLEDHTGLAELRDESKRWSNLQDWFGKLSTERAQEEYGLIQAEIIWCAETPLSEFRRIASSEARRFLDV
jgi:hypothetical protein